MFKIKLATKVIIWDGVCLDEEDMLRECKYKKMPENNYLVEFANNKRNCFNEKNFGKRFKLRLPRR